MWKRTTTVDRKHFFTSRHIPSGNYNESHPCRIVRKGFVERGWYVNSFYKISRFRGYKFGPISFGLITGYSRGEFPYMILHWNNKFYVPAFFLGNGLWFIVCTYEENSWKHMLKLAVSRLRRNGEWIMTQRKR
ncbi:MAG: hypothetical protein CBB97_22420 [Candidatus Endolissoclinum sp. TMED37]|nr:MAG: hypothetical protein CBB97_22420 [Candidatus Endolissoclinum sp. TMED37]